MEKDFVVARSREEAAAVLREDETLIGLFPDTKTEVVESTADRKTTRSQYQALGRDGVATFHFTFQPTGDVVFAKLCDGNVWKKLEGRVSFEVQGERTRVRIEMEGSTKTLVPEFTIRGPMRDQIDQMAAALKNRIEASQS